MNLQAEIGAGYLVVNDYVISVTEIQGGRRLVFTRGNEESHIDIIGERSVAGTATDAQGRISFTFSDGSVYTTPPLKGADGARSFLELEDVPQSFPPEAHTHGIGDVTGLSGALDAVRTLTAPAYADLTFPVSAGSYCVHGGKLYKAKDDIASSEDWTAAHWDETDAGAELVSIKNSIDEIQTTQLQDGTYALTLRIE